MHFLHIFANDKLTFGIVLFQNLNLSIIINNPAGRHTEKEKQGTLPSEDGVEPPFPSRDFDLRFFMIFLNFFRSFRLPEIKISHEDLFSMLWNLKKDLPTYRRVD